MDDTDVAGALLADGTVLDKDNIPNKNQSLKCFSCSEEMTGVFCAACGQKNDDYRRSIFRLIGELIGSFTALESRIWRTWGALLFKPGKVAREFADGARIKWSTPIRVFLAVSILLFGFMTLTKTQLFSIDFNVLPKDGITKQHSELGVKDLRIKGAVRFFQTQDEIDAQNETRNFDLIEKWLNGGNGIYINSMGKNIYNGSQSIAGETAKELGAADEDRPKEGAQSETDEARDKLEAVIKERRVKLEAEKAERKARLETLMGMAGEDVSDEQNQEILDLGVEFGDKVDKKTQAMYTNMFINVIRNPKAVNAAIYKWLPRVMFLMMPITMFIGIVFIRGRGNALLYDHLVHAAYIHSVAFFLLFVGIVLMRVFPGAFVAKTLFIILLIYLPLSLKRMFRRGWFKTIWTSYGVGVIYFFLVNMVMTGAVSYQVYQHVTQAG